MSFEFLKSDGRRQFLSKAWETWLREADRWYVRYLREVDESPFACHEVAAVGFLSCAAARAGFLTLNEYELKKRSQLDRRCKVSGRADLWMVCDGTAYSFEFKRAWHAATEGNLKETLRGACGDISVVPDDECHYAAGGVIAFVTDESRLPLYGKFARHSDVDMAYRIGPKAEDAVFLYFALKS